MTLAHLMTPDERRTEAFALIDFIKAAIAAGKSFTNPRVGEFFTSMRDRLKEHGLYTRVSPDQLSALRRVARGLEGKRK